VDSLYIQLGIPALTFITVWYLLGNSVFKPFLANLEEREDRTTGDEKRAAEARQKTAQLHIKLEEQLKIARLEGIRMRDDYAAQAKLEAGRTQDQALQVALKQLDGARAEIETIKAKVRSELQGEAQALSGAILDKLLRNSAERVIH